MPEDRKKPERLAPPIEVVLLDEIAGRLGEMQQLQHKTVATRQWGDKFTVTTEHYRYILHKSGTIWNDGPDALYILNDRHPVQAGDPPLAEDDSYVFDYGICDPHEVWLASAGTSSVRIMQLG